MSSAQFASLSLKAVNKAADKYHDKVYDKISPPKNWSSQSRRSSSASSSNSAQHSDDESSHHGKHSRRSRKGTSDGLEENQYPAQPSAGNEYSYQQSRYAPGYAPPAEYGAWDNYEQTSYPQLPSQVSSYVPPSPQSYQPLYVPFDATAEEPRRPPNRRQRSYSLPPPPSRSRRRDKSSSDVDLTSGAIGALAGGLVGAKFGKGHTLTTAVAAVIGAVGANQLEKRHRKGERKKRRGEDGR